MQGRDPDLPHVRTTFLVTYRGGAVLVRADSEGQASMHAIRRRDIRCGSMTVWRPSKDDVFHCLQQGIEVLEASP